MGILTINHLSSVFDLHNNKNRRILIAENYGSPLLWIVSVSFYYLLNKGLGWKNKMSFFVALIFLLQPAVLRTGWDQFREEFSLSLFFILLATTRCDLIAKTKPKFMIISVLSTLIFFSHQLVAVLLLVVLIYQLGTYQAKKTRAYLATATLILPLSMIFSWQLYFQFLNPQYNPHLASILLPGFTSNFVFTNYFLSDPRFLDGNYLTVLTYVGSLLLLTVGSFGSLCV